MPISIDIDTLRNIIYVGDYMVPGQSTPTSNTVMIINGKTTNVTGKVSIEAGHIGLEVNQITNKIYVLNNGQSNVTIIDGGTKTASPTRPSTGFGPQYI